MRKCDIIIPVYNAYDAVIECIDSVLKNTGKNGRIILIDDKSPDERIIPLLEKYEKENKSRIVLLKNDVNLGFVKTVNKGMMYSKDDVLLLNSDTEVPHGWLDRIIECAYSDALIGTVTPLSNNATLASVPKMFTRNELPDGYDLKAMDSLVNECSEKVFPEIPTAHGFCMFIKRSVLDVVGFFDEKNFGKGYGEENDFSFRCFKYGYRNVLCDNVYVLHKESQSFQDKKVDNSAALANKHPELKSGLDYWCRIRDIQNIGNNVALNLGLKNNNPNILFIVHDFSNIDENVGGTTLHILDIINSLREKYNFHVLAPENGFYKIHSFFKDSDVITGIYKKPVIIEPIGIKSNQYKLMIREIVKKYGISFVHIHHMIGHYFDVGDVCEEMKIKYVVSLHDFYLDTPIVSMLDEKVDAKQKLPIDIDAWRNASHELLKHAFKVIAPSEFVKNRFLKIYKNQSITVIPHGVHKSNIRIEHKEEPVKNIAFVGAIFPHKGSELLEGMVRAVKTSDNLKIHLFGMTTANVEKGKCFINHGKYNRKDLPSLLKDNNIDLLCAFSLAPETFAYTVEEVVSAGVPVLSFNIGAAAERVKQHKLGWVVDYTDNSRTMINTIKDIFSNTTEYNRILSSVNKYETRGVEVMSKDYGLIYAKNTEPLKLDKEYLKNKMITDDMVTIASRMNNGYMNEYFDIINSAKWRVVSKIKVPVKAKRIIKKVYRRVRK